MKPKEIIRLVLARGCSKLRQKGSHARFTCPGGCATTIAIHNDDIKPKTLHSIEKDLEPCLGKSWLRERSR